MGIIANRLTELEPELSEINTYVNELGVDFYSYDTKLIGGIEERFAILKPYRYKSKEIFRIDIDNRLVLGRGIRMKTHWSRGVGSVLGMQFLQIMVDYSGPIILNVRKPIKETFIRAINIISDVKTLNKDILVPLAIKEIGDKRIELGSTNTWHRTTEKVFLKSGFGDTSSSITFPRNKTELTAADIAIAEDIIGDIVELYRDGYAKVQAIKKHNEVKLKELDDVFTPYRVAKKLSK